jgi:hypothetical protein
MRDGNGPRALETLVRYRGSVLVELFRALASPRSSCARQEPTLWPTPAGLPVAAAPGKPSLPPWQCHGQTVATTKRTRESAPKQGLGLPA